MIRVKLTVSPIKGSANKHCIKFLSSFFKIPKSRIEINRGSTSKEKWLWFKDLDPFSLFKVLDTAFFHSS